MTAKHYLLIALLIALAFGVGYCNRQSDSVVAEIETTAETERKAVVNTDSIFHAGFLQGEAKGAARYKVLQRDSAAAASKDKRATEKAQHSANTYLKTPTLANCDTAFTDCQEEVKAKVVVIATRDKMLLAKDSTLVKRMSEIDRQVAVIDTLNTGWKKANEDNAVLTEKVEVEKEKNWGLGGQIGGTLFNGKPTYYIGAGLNYNFIRFRIKLPKKRSTEKPI